MFVKENNENLEELAAEETSVWSGTSPTVSADDNKHSGDESETNEPIDETEELDSLELQTRAEKAAKDQENEQDAELRPMAWDKVEQLVNDALQFQPKSSNQPKPTRVHEDTLPAWQQASSVPRSIGGLPWRLDSESAADCNSTEQ